jgi:uncharacterized protein (DUF2267 family)
MAGGETRMTWPFEYQNAQSQFDRFLRAVADAADVATTNAAYTIVDAVFIVFARRLTPEQVLAFSRVLPPLLRSLFIGERNPEEPARSFGSRAALTAEVLDIRAHHNFAPPDAIEIVARELRRVVDTTELESVLSRLPAGAAEYWRG